jgi:hypothetical protein
LQQHHSCSKKSATFTPKYTDTLHDVACCPSRFALRTLW